MNGDYGFEDYVQSTNDAFEKGIPSNFARPTEPTLQASILPKPTKNTVKKWSHYQGYYYDTSIQLRRYLDTRRVTLQNSGGTPVVAAFWTEPKDRASTVTILLKPKHVITLGINLRDEPTQFIDLINPVTRGIIGITREIPSDATDLVLREGHNGWWVQTFKQNLW